MMAKDANSAACLAGIISRTRKLRENRFLTPDQMAELLGASSAAYRKYELRTPLPHHYIEKFCLITGAPIHYLITGKLK